MHSVTGFVASYVMNAVWETALIFLAAWIVGRMLRRLGPQAEHAVWVAALFTAIITPFLPMLQLFSGLIMNSPASGGRAGLILFVDEGGAPGGSGVLSLAQSWVSWLLAFYFVCGLILAARLLLSLRGTARLLRRAVPAKLPPEQEEIWRLRREAFSLEEARILVSAAVPGPVALGLRRPVLLLPTGFADRCAPDDFLAAVTHECAHLKRRDFQKNLGYEAVSLALAFHPLMWIIKSRIAQTREMICDAIATEGHVDGPSYGRSLLRLAAMVAATPRRSTIHAIGIFDAGVLEKRIMRIRVKKQHAGAVLRCGLIGAASAILLSVAISAAAMGVVIAPQAAAKDSTQAGAYGHVYRVGHGVSAPVPLNTVAAEFPKAVRKDKKVPGGIVIVRIIVDADGLPQDVRVFRSYRPDFDAEAVKAVKKYRFRPAMREGKPVAVSISVEVNFKRY